MLRDLAYPAAYLALTIAVALSLVNQRPAPGRRGRPTAINRMGAILLARVATPAIVTTFLVSVALMAVSLWGHRRLAGALGRPGCLSMGAFVLSWVFGIAATLTGLFPLALVFGR